MKLPVSAVNVDQIGSSDSVQFSERKIPSITIHSLTQPGTGGFVALTSPKWQLES
jgi:Iap family predicted aminopeptidase